MNEDLTQKLPPQSFEERVLAEFAAMRQEFAAVHSRLAALEDRVVALDTRMTSLESRLTSLEEKVDERLRETRPIWEGVLQRLTQIETVLNDFNRQVRSLIADMYQMRLRVEKLEDSQTNV
jgi:chromosome segregation ATPase